MKKFSKILFILGAMTILPTPSLGASVQLAVCEAVWAVAEQIYNATDHFEDWVGQMEQTCGNMPSQYITFCESCINEIFYPRSSCFRLCDCGTLFFQSQREKIFLSL